MKTRKPYQEAFLSNTTRVGFHLKLTNAMLEMLCALSEDVSWDRHFLKTLFNPDNWLATERALMKRGLIVQKSESERKEILHGTDPCLCRPFWRLTPCGEAVVEMLRAGGLFIRAEIAKERIAKRKHA